MTDYNDLGTYSRTVSTESPDAQRWFDRGLLWCYGFNHTKAKRCFNEAAEIDPGCAMAYWGIAYSVGPSFTKPWEAFDESDLSQSLIEADSATQTAIELADCVSCVELDIIKTLPHRYPSDIPAEDPNTWNMDYADAMRAVYKTYPNDLDVAALCVEAILKQTAFKLWDLDSGVPVEGAEMLEAIAILDKAIQQMEQTDLGLSHPGIVHLYIRLMGSSSHPERTQSASDKLKELVPDAEWQAGVFGA